VGDDGHHVDVRVALVAAHGGREGNALEMALRMPGEREHGPPHLVDHTATAERMAVGAHDPHPRRQSKLGGADEALAPGRGLLGLIVIGIDVDDFQLRVGTRGEIAIIDSASGLGSGLGDWGLPRGTIRKRVRAVKAAALGRWTTWTWSRGLSSPVAIPIDCLGARV